MFRLFFRETHANRRRRGRTYNTEQSLVLAFFPFQARSAVVAMSPGPHGDCIVDEELQALLFGLSTRIRMAILNFDRALIKVEIPHDDVRRVLRRK